MHIPCEHFFHFLTQQDNSESRDGLYQLVDAAPLPAEPAGLQYESFTPTATMDELAPTFPELQGH